jgi:hypothetical protein
MNAKTLYLVLFGAGLLLVAVSAILRMMHILIFRVMAMGGMVFFIAALCALLYTAIKAVPAGQSKFNATTVLLSAAIIMFCGELLIRVASFIGNLLFTGGIFVAAVCFCVIVFAQVTGKKKG